MRCILCDNEKRDLVLDGTLSVEPGKPMPIAICRECWQFMVKKNPGIGLTVKFFLGGRNVENQPTLPFMR